MINRKLQLLIIAKKGEQGYTLVVGIILGLIMSLAALGTVIQSQDEQTLSQAQINSSKASTVAEIGVSRFRNMLSLNKVLAMYPAKGNTNSWQNPANIPGVTLSCYLNTEAQITTATQVGTWQNVDSSDPKKGQYRLIDYVYNDNYDNSTNTYTALPYGLLTVEGRISDSGNYTADNKTIATSRLEVNIPVQPGIPRQPSNATISLSPSLNFFDPALWVRAGSTTNVSGLSINGNILFFSNSCTIPTGGGNPTAANLVDSAAQAINVNRIPMPNPPAAPATVPTTVNTVTSDDINAAANIPRFGDVEDANNYYHYSITNPLNIDTDGLSIVEGTKVIFYVNGNISLQGDINNNNNTSAFLEIYSATAAQVSFVGDTNFTGFIHAPSATVTTTNNPTVDFTGAMWVNNVNMAGGNINITPDDQYLNYTPVINIINANNRFIDPIIQRPSLIESKEVQ